MAWWKKPESSSEPEIPALISGLPTPPELSPEERMAAAIKEMRTAFQQAAKAEEANRSAGVAEEKSKLERARKFVKETGIDRALCRVLAEVWHWPSWSRNNPDDFIEKRNSLSFENISGIEGRADGKETKVVGFRCSGQEYEIRFERYTGYLSDCDTNFGKLYLACNGVCVFGVDVSQKLETEYYQWRAGDVLALQPGEWIGNLVIWEETLESKAKAQSSKYHAENIVQRASKIDL